MAEEKTNAEDIAGSFLLAHGYRDGKVLIRSWRGDFYLWEGGIYRKIGKDELKARLVQHMGTMAQIASPAKIDNVKLHLLPKTFLADERLPDTWLNDGSNEPINAIVTENRILVFDDGGWVRQIDHTPDFFCLNKVPYAYDASAGCGRWMQFLEEVTMGDKELQRMLQQWAGYLLTSNQKYQCFILLLGDAATGKGTFTRAMKAMLGKENCSDVPLRRFTNNFSVYQTYGKKLNVAGDAEEELTPQVEAVVKTWTGMDGLDFERKYADGFSAQATAKLMILANNPPAFTDKSMGTWRRLKVVPFRRENTEYMESGLDEKLETELPGILNWAIAGLKDLEVSGGFVTASQSKKIWNEYRYESNPAGIFLNENYEYDPGWLLGVQTSLIYTAYQQWCKRSGYRALSDRTFGREVFRAFPLTAKRRLGHERRYLIYKGLKLRKDADIRYGNNNT